jgi:uncharacterized phage-associated protein
MRDDTSILDVVRYILTTIGNEVTSMKLHKLCYYSQAGSLVWHDKPLFKEDFEHWENGPVCRELFKKHDGEFYVGWDTFKLGIDEDEIKKEGLTSEEEATVELILGYFGGLQGEELTAIVKTETPWLTTAENQVIPKEMMRDYYSKSFAWPLELRNAWEDRCEHLETLGYYIKPFCRAQQYTDE